MDAPICFPSWNSHAREKIAFSFQSITITTMSTTRTTIIMEIPLEWKFHFQPTPSEYEFT